MSRIDQPGTTPYIASRDPRKTEDTDTRQALQRHDPEFYKKKKDEGEQQGFKDPYEDLTDVSVAALRNFLMGLLDRMPHAETASAPSYTHEAETRQPANPKAAAAISAYQSGAGRGVAPQPPPPAVPPPPQGSALDQAAAGLDRALLLELIRELDRIAAQGVTAIALEKGESFLESIKAAIEKARDNFAGA